MMTSSSSRPVAPPPTEEKQPFGDENRSDTRSFEETFSDKTDVKPENSDSAALQETSKTPESSRHSDETDTLSTLSLNPSPTEAGDTDAIDGDLTHDHASISTLTIDDPTSDVRPDTPSNIGLVVERPQQTKNVVTVKADRAIVDAQQTTFQSVNAAATPETTDTAVERPVVDPTLKALETQADPTLKAVDTATESTGPVRQTDLTLETAEYRAATKVQTNLSANPIDPLKIADAAPSTATLLASADTATPLKSLPALATTSTLTPMASMSDRLAASILQTTNANPVVTLDKLPQAVVAVAMSAKSATLQIDPPELGRIQLEYQFDIQGRTVVTLTPESEAARAALMDRMASITAALEQGSSSPIDVKLGDARNFGSEFDQSSQDGQDSGSQDGSNSGSANTASAPDLQRFMRAPDGEPDRLHILV